MSMTYVQVINYNRFSACINFESERSSSPSIVEDLTLLCVDTRSTNLKYFFRSLMSTKIYFSQVIEEHNTFLEALMSKKIIFCVEGII